MNIGEYDGQLCITTAREGPSANHVQHQNKHVIFATNTRNSHPDALSLDQVT